MLQKDLARGHPECACSTFPERGRLVSTSRETLRDMPHVDVVKNEWLAGFQHVVARVFPEGDEVHVDTEDPDRWEPIILRSFVAGTRARRSSPTRGRSSSFGCTN